MGHRYFFLSVCAMILHSNLLASPLIQKISNDTDFGFLIMQHSDTSSCSLQDKGMIVHAHSDFNHEFLLEVGQPSVVLRPVYYLNPTTKKKMWLVNEHAVYVPEKVQLVHEAWRNNNKNKGPKTHDIWLHEWVGLDISVIPHQVEIFGYLLNLSRVILQNSKTQRVEWLSFAKGIFAKLVIELRIQQHKRKGISASLKILHGTGGVCVNGTVEHLAM